jgi:hypothetical protein
VQNSVGIAVSASRARVFPPSLDHEERFMVGERTYGPGDRRVNRATAG